MKALYYSAIISGSIAIPIQIVMMSKYGVISWWGLLFLFTAPGFIRALREVINGE